MFVIYHKETTKFLRLMKDGMWRDADRFLREQDAKACLTRIARKIQAGRMRGPNATIVVSDYLIAERKHFLEHIEKKEVRKGIIHSQGKDFEAPVNTSWTSGPWSETYFSS